MKVAFFKGTHPGVLGLFNRLVRWATRSNVSHVELLLCSGDCVSATGVDKGVRLKKIDLSNTKMWQLVDVPPEIQERDVLDRLGLILDEAKETGGGYDYFGLFATMLPFLCREHPTKYFCSELVATLLGIKQPWRFNPATLEALLEA
jgi:hypothetical protein